MNSSTAYIRHAVILARRLQLESDQAFYKLPSEALDADAVGTEIVSTRE